MELKFMTPKEVWEDYDPTQAPLESSTISAETTDNTVCLKQTFSLDPQEQPRTRVYMEIYYDDRWTDARSTVLLLPNPTDTPLADMIDMLLHEGYVVGAVDYAKISDESSFAPSISYAVYPECFQHLDAIESSPRKTPWYVWNKIARRAITLLAETPLVDKERIGVIGIGTGAHLAWQVAGMDKRVRALVPICGGGYRWASDKPRFVAGNVPSTEEEIAYSTGVGSETYAKFVECPTFYLTSRMSQYCDVDRAGDILSLVKSDYKQLLIMRSVDIEITMSAFKAVLAWLRNSFSTGAKTDFSPTMQFEVTEGKLYLRLHTGHKATSAKVHISSSEPSPYARHWTRVENLQKVGTHEYTVFLPVHDPNDLIVAYATFTYDGDNAASTPVIGAIPAKLGAVSTDASTEFSRIIYDNSMNTDVFSVKADGVLLPDDLLIKEAGPFDIEGVGIKEGSLLLCRSEREISMLARTTALHFDAYSPVERELKICLYTMPDQKRYTARTQLRGGEFWQKVLLSIADFKSDEGRTLTKFSNAKVLILSDAKGTLFNNFLWI